MQYQPSSPNAPPIGLNPSMNPGYPPPTEYPGSGYPPSGYPPGYPPAQGFPPAQGYPPAPGYPPTGGYPAPQPTGGYMPPQPGYPPEQPPMYPPPDGYGPPGVTTTQPVAMQGYPVPGQADENWMVPPSGLVCPPGLEYLTTIDHLFVKQKVEMLEAFLGFETQNKYTIKNNLGQKIYTAKEDTDCCTRNCLGPLRPFDMKIKDSTGREVIHLDRPMRCQSCLCPCFLQKLEVMAPPGTTAGYVTQEWSMLSPSFSVQNAAGECVLRIEGPICTFSICGNVEFKVLSKDGQFEVGKISKQWSGILREAFTDSDYFGISFPMDLDVSMKAVLLGACFLIDYMFFEKSGNSEQDAPGML